MRPVFRIIIQTSSKNEMMILLRLLVGGRYGHLFPPSRFSSQSSLTSHIIILPTQILLLL
jgi:hypothetical protein